MSAKKDEKNHPTRACLIVNARSPNSATALAESLPALTAQGWEVAVREKKEKGQATELARDAESQGYDPIVGCGGDGTLNEIVEALSERKAALGVIPAGTANVWSREIGVVQRPKVAATQLAASERVRVDVGRLEINGRHERYFLMMAGLGADGAVMSHASRSLKDRLGPLAIGVAAAQALPALRSVEAEVEMDGVRWSGRITQIIAGNTRHYGGFTQVTPDAYIDDGLLDVCLFTTDGLVQIGRQLTSLLVRQHPSYVSAESYRAARVVIRTDAPLPVQIDGSAVEVKNEDGPVEYTLHAIPRGLHVLVPRTYDGPLFEHGLVGSSKRRGKRRKKSE